MAAIQKRTRNGKTSYRVRYRDPSHTQRSKSFDRRVDAERFARTVEVEKDAGTWIDPKAGRTTLAEWRTRFVATELGNRASTRARDESYWRNHMGPILGPRPLASIDYATVQGWVGDLSARVSPATVAKAYGILSKTLNGAVKAGLIPANRAEGVELPRIEREEQQFLTVGEIDRLA
ncbi:MAG: site-specific integrase, partial [Acidimicrobiales bacterium]